MYRIIHLHCCLCDFELPWVEPAILYLEDSQGRRIVWGSPSEYAHLHLLKDRKYKYGVLSCCLCLNCLMESKLDLGECSLIPWDWNGAIKAAAEPDDQQCSICSSHNLIKVNDLVRTVCPSCEEGILVKEEKYISTHSELYAIS